MLFQLMIFFILPNYYRTQGFFLKEILMWSSNRSKNKSSNLIKVSAGTAARKLVRSRPENGKSTILWDLIHLLLTHWNLLR